MSTSGSNRLLNGRLKNIEEKIAGKRDEILKLESTLAHGQEFVSGEMSQKLTEPQFKETSQREYMIEKQQAELQAIA
jgi:hypothetical protein